MMEYKYYTLVALHLAQCNDACAKARQSYEKAHYSVDGSRSHDEAAWNNYLGCARALSVATFYFVKL